jgi:hypothetical protein
MGALERFTFNQFNTVESWRVVEHLRSTLYIYPDAREADAIAHAQRIKISNQKLL